MLLTKPLDYLFLGVSLCGFLSGFSNQTPQLAPLAKTGSNITFLDVLDLHKKLVSIPLVLRHEHEISDYLWRFLRSHGMETLPSFVDGRRSILAYFPHSEDPSRVHRKVLLTSHIDTVPPYISYRYDRDTETIYGRGVNDAKSCVAVQILSALELYRSGQLRAQDFAFLYVVGEEIDGDGMKQAMVDFGPRFSFDTAIFGEPTENKLGRGHKGNYMFHIQANGLAAHLGYPQLGVSANEILVDVLHELLKNQDKLPSLDALGPTTFNIGQIEGGIAQNVIPSQAKAGVFFRVAAELDQVALYVDSIVKATNDRYRQKYPKFEGQFVETANISRKEPQFLDYDVPGFGNIALAYATDIPDFNMTVSRRYLYGPGSILTAHGDNEQVSVSDLKDSWVGYKKLVLYSVGLELELD